MSTNTMNAAAGERTDPIDQLVPPPRSLPVRMLIGLLVVGLVGTVSFLVGFGYVYPQPECCGAGGGSPFLTLADDGESVVLMSTFYNSSGRTLVADGAEVSLPGARVVDVRLAPGMRTGVEVPAGAQPVPVAIGGHDMGQLVVRFVPEACDIGPVAAWGSAVLHLQVDNGWLPSFGRDWRLPDPLVDTSVDDSGGSGGTDLGVMSPEGYPGASPSGDPLRDACALLGR